MYWDGSVTNAPVSIAMKNLSSAQCEVRFDTLRGFYYKLQSTTDLNLPMSDEPGGATLAVNSSIASTNTIAGKQKFFRAVASPSP